MLSLLNIYYIHWLAMHAVVWWPRGVDMEIMVDKVYIDIKLNQIMVDKVYIDIKLNQIMVQKVLVFKYLYYFGKFFYSIVKGV